ncbi:MAG: hypothetical protein ACI81L_000594, partial [Verrucomicrobiales bacterium]
MSMIDRKHVRTVVVLRCVGTAYASAANVYEEFAETWFGNGHILDTKIVAAMKYCGFHQLLPISLEQKGYAMRLTNTGELMTLAEETAALAVAAGANATPERKAIYGKAQQHVEAAGILETALKVGDRAPMFELPGADGVMVKLADVLK